MKSRKVAILGAGIMGSSLALFAARRGMQVQLYDMKAQPFTGASRWNEGKIHLGYLYGADSSLATARRILPGGLAFYPLVSELTGRDVKAYASDHDDRYLIHKNSVVSPDAALTVARRVADLAKQHADANQYFEPLYRAKPRPLGRHELSAYGPEIVAGFEVPERSVCTQCIADDFVECLHEEPNIVLNMDHRVKAVEPTSGRWSVLSEHHGQSVTEGLFDSVFNCLWEGRGLVDATAGIRHTSTWTHRYRASLFVRTSSPVNLHSGVIAVGPFGDVKNYDHTKLYLSWYPAGLLAESTALEPPAVPQLTDDIEREICSLTISELTRHIPDVAELSIEEMKVRGGWVYAAGTGDLIHPASDLHRRDEVGVVEKNGYFSVDTGKYSIAPWLAWQLVQAL